MITRKTILSLIEQTEKPSISIYLPTHVKGEQMQQDPIRFKNLLNRAEKKLQEQHQVDQTIIDKLLEKPRELLEQPDFWQHGDKGMAVFITLNLFETYRLPLDFKEQVLVENHFLITPLLPMTTLEGTYCVAALSQKKIRLLKCTPQATVPIELEEVPTSMDEFTQYDVSERHLQLHSGRGDGKAIFHGQGGRDDTEKDALLNYFKIAENEITTRLARRNDPLILAGINEAVALYKKVNHYNRTMEESLTLNPDPLSDDELNRKAWKIIKSYFLKQMYHDKERFGDLIGSDKQSDNLSQVVEASYYGRVDSLFVPIGEQSWGWFNEERDTVHHSTEQQDGEHDLINMAAIKTLLQGGNVYALEKDTMPNDSAIAAIFRY